MNTFSEHPLWKGIMVNLDDLTLIIEPCLTNAGMVAEAAPALQAVQTARRAMTQAMGLSFSQEDAIEKCKNLLTTAHACPELIYALQQLQASAQLKRAAPPLGPKVAQLLMADTLSEVPVYEPIQ